MSRSKNKKDTPKQKGGAKINQVVFAESNLVLGEKYIKLQAEAYYRAMKRLEKEKAQREKVQKEKFQNRKLWERIYVFFCSLFMPWFDIGKNRINSQIYDEMLVLPISTLLMGGGTLFYFVGIIAFVISITDKMKYNIFTSMISLFVFIMGSLMVLSGRAFREEQDSMKIYAYSASIIALISCVVSIVALLRK